MNHMKDIRETIMPKDSCKSNLHSVIAFRLKRCINSLLVNSQLPLLILYRNLPSDFVLFVILQGLTNKSRQSKHISSRVLVKEIDHFYPTTLIPFLLNVKASTIMSDIRICLNVFPWCHFVYNLKLISTGDTGVMTFCYSINYSVKTRNFKSVIQSFLRIQKFGL